MGDIKCSCGHLRKDHDIEPPYECTEVVGDSDDYTLCECTGFAVEPTPEKTPAQRRRTDD